MVLKPALTSEVEVTREIPDLELHKRVVGHQLHIETAGESERRYCKTHDIKSDIYLVLCGSAGDYYCCLAVSPMSAVQEEGLMR